MIPFLVDSKRVVTDVAVELSRSQAPPTLPFELRDYVSPNTWEARVSALTRLASQYSRPTFERAYLIIIMALSFLVPITTYYVTLQSLEGTTDDVDRQVWLARFSCFAVTIATWIVLSAPMILWKYLGKVRVTRVADLWTRADALSAPSYGAAPVWKASAPGLLRDAVVLVVTVPLIQKSHFDRDSYLPPVRTFSPWFALCMMN
ncbi:hypothetical protein L210DRAFT_3502115 [Boletus edulis BED1]|uniref:Uncharacterized protein n=1 Tax=Boletus edulis BED1 TaxID=1328754 RepID=A0AAD4BZP8_BOLED|nr:hypothetical protein L210DRAFT_3502115 [Boletus edulis BED1]